MFNLSVVITVSLCAIGAVGIAYKCKKKYCGKGDDNNSKKKDQDAGAEAENWEEFGEATEGKRQVFCVFERTIFFGRGNKYFFRDRLA